MSNNTHRSSLTQIEGKTSAYTVSPVSVGSSWKSLSVGASHAVAIKNNGTLWAWGSNQYGQVGNGGVATQSSPVQIGSFTWLSTSAGANHSMALRSDGLLFGWGLNSSYQLGNNGVPYSNYWKQVVSGLGHTMLIKSDNTLWSLGSNVQGQLGNNTVTATTSPIQIGTSSWSMVRASALSTYAIDINGRLFTWGFNANGELGLGDATYRSSPVQLGTSLWSMVASAAGYGTLNTAAFAIDISNNLFAWGMGTNGQLGDNTIVSKNSPVLIGTRFVKVAATDASAAAINLDGKLFTWGVNTVGQLGLNDTVARSAPTQIPTTYVWSDIASSTNTNFGLTNTGLLFGWGQNTAGKLGDGTTINRSTPVQIMTNISKLPLNPYLQTGVIDKVGNLWMWGDNTAGGLGDGTTISRSTPVQIGNSQWAVVASTTSGTLGITTDNKLWAWGKDSVSSELYFASSEASAGASRSSPTQTGAGLLSDSPVQIGTSSWVAVSAGVDHTLAIRSDKTLWAWGNNSVGQLIAPQFAGQLVSSPVQVGASSYVSVSAGNRFSLAITSDNKLVSAGNNTNNQLGSNSFSTLYSWSMIVDSPSHTLAIRNDGLLFAWGNNSGGQLGDGTTINRSSPVQIGTDSWTFIAADGNTTTVQNTTSFAIRKDGKLFGWGNDGWGQLGQNQINTYRSSPIQVGTNLFSKVDMGPLYHVVALDNAGTLWTWGNNATGQLGNGDTVSRSSPVQINTGSWSQVAAGNSSSFAIRSDGKLFGWGGNLFGDLGLGDAATPKLVITQIGNSSWTQVFTKRGTSDANGTAWAIRADGKLFGWGANTINQIGDGTTINRSSPVQIGSYNWSKISAQGPSRVGVQTDGSLWYWGNKSAATGADFATATFTYSWTLVAGGNLSSYGIRQDGTLWSWGNNNTGQVGDNTTVSRSAPVQLTLGSTYWKDVSGGGSFAVAIDSNNQLYTWGKNDAGQMGINTNTTSSSPVQIRSPLSSFTTVSSGNMHSLAIDADGKLWSWGSNSYRQLGLTDPVYGYLSWSQVSASRRHSMFIRADGRLFAAGDNGRGQLGDGSTITKSSPVIIGSESWLSISAGTEQPTGGSNYTLGIRADGTLWSWGYNTTGLLGVGDTNDRSSPVQIGSGSWLAVSAGNTVAYAIRQDGKLFAWGTNVSNVFGSPSKFYATSSPVQITTKTYSKISTKQDLVGTDGFTLALDTDNKLWAWGSNSVGQIGRLLYNNWTSVAITNDASRTMFGIKDGGILYAWGDRLNTSAQYNDPSSTLKSSPVVVGQETPDYVKFASVVGGYSHIYSISTEGKLYGMGVPAAGYGLPDVYSWSQITSYSNTTYAIRSDGKLFGWGNNQFTQIPNYTGWTSQAYRSAPVQIGFSSWSQLASVAGLGVLSVAAITSDGRLFAWGKNDNGQYGAGDTVTRDSPVQVGVGYTWTSAIVGVTTHLYLRSDNLLFGSGLNTKGIFGAGGVAVATNRSSPVQISSQRFTSVAVVNENVTNTLTALAIDASARLYTWGSGLNGQLGDGTTIDRSSPVQIGTSSWIAVASANKTAVAITTDNRLFSWGGDTTYYTLGSSSKPWKMIYTTGSTTYGIDLTGKLWGWGAALGTYGIGDGLTTYRSSPVQIGTNTNWTNISSGGDTALATTATGGLWAWGRNVFGAAGDSTTINRSSPVQISSASFPVIVAGVFMTSAAIDTQGQLYTWGSNGGVLGDGTTIARSQPVQIAGSWADVAIGNSVIFAIKSDRTLWSWGSSLGGQLGTSSFVDRSSPVQVGTSSWLTVSAGFKNFAAAIDMNNRLFTWGTNADGQMGDNTTISRSSPVLVTAGLAGSVSLTGSGSLVSTSTINFGTGLFTVEGWFYRTSAVGSNTSYWGTTNGTGTTTKIIFNQMNTGELRVYQTTGEASMTTSTTLVPQNTWVHIAVVRDAVVPAVIKIYVNGVQQPLSVSNASIDYSSITGIFNIGADGEGAYSPFPGYISNFRVVTGVAVYTGNFTVSPEVLSPTQPSSTNISALTESQTQLLAYATTVNDSSFYNRTLTLSNASSSAFGPIGYKWTQAYAGNGSIIARRIDNTFWVWGLNSNGELSIGDNIPRSSPVQLSAFSKESIVLNNITIQPINSSSTNNAVLYNNGSGLIWGTGNAGAIGDNTVASKSSPVQISADPARSSPVQVGTDYWRKIAGGGYHFIGQQTDGKIYAWGNNTQGQLGTGDTGFRGAPTLINNTSFPVVQLAAGTSSTFAKLSDKVYGWGGNSQGELGDNSTLNRSIVAQVATNSVYTLQQFFDGSSYTQVASYNHTMAVKSDGTLWTWGRNNTGQVGDGTTLDRSSPVQIAGSWTQVEVGYSTSIALRTDSTLWVWGDNSYGHLGQSSTNNRSNPVQVSGSWTKIAATGYATYAINTLGQLYAWGNNTSHGQLGQNDTVSRSSPVQIAGSWTNITSLGNTTFGVKVGDTLWAWGGNLNGESGLNDLSSRSSPVQVSVAGTGSFTLPKSSANWGASSGGNNATAYIKNNMLFVMGNNVQGQLGSTAGGTVSSPVQVGTYLSTNMPSPVQVSTNSWTQISAGSDHAAAITTDGRLFTWGSNAFNQLGGGGGDYLSISTNANSNNNSSGSNLGFSAFIKNDGSLWMVGLNTGGQLGDGTTVNKSSPVQIGTAGYWKQVSVGQFNTLAIDYLNRLWAWGNNTWGSLGTGNTTSVSSPVQIGTSSWSQVATGYWSSHAIDINGKLWSWGRNNYGGLGLNNGTSYNSPVQVGTDTDWDSIYMGAWSGHVHAIKNNKTLWAWGYNAGGTGRLGDGTNVSQSSPVQISGSWTMVSHNGEYYSQGWDGFGIKTDGTLWAWGQTFQSSSPVQQTVDGVTSWLAVYGSLYGAYALTSNNRMYYVNMFNFTTGSNSFDWIGTSTGDVTTWTLLSATVNFRNVGPHKNFRLGQVWPTVDNKLYAWGDNGIGLLGQNDTVSRSSPVQLGTNPNAFSPTQVVSGSWNQVKTNMSSTVAINSDGYLYTWGVNTSGQLGTGDTLNRSEPTLIPVGTNAYINAVQYSSGNNNRITDTFTFGFAAGNFTIEAWVYPTTTNTRRGIINNWSGGGAFYFDITASNVLLFGYTNIASGISTPEYTGATTISPNVWTHVAIVRNGSAWRFYINGVADTNPYTSSDTMYYYNAAPKSIIIGLGYDGTFPFTGKISGLRVVKGVAVYTGNFTVPTTPLTSIQGAGTNINAITGTQTLLLSNQLPILGDISSFNWTITNVGSPTIVSASEVFTGVTSQTTYLWSNIGTGIGDHNNVIRTDGTLWSVGNNTLGQLAINSITNRSSFVAVGTTVARFNAALTKVDNQSYTVVSAGFGQSLAIRKDSTLWGWGLNTSNAIDGTATPKWSKVYAGGVFGALITTFGELYLWGENGFGIIGDNTYITKPGPTKTGNDSWAMVSVGSTFVHAIKADGTLWGWGLQNGSYVIGDGTTINRSSPVQIGSASNWTQVSSGYYNTIALNSLGQLYAWGSLNTSGQLGDNTTVVKSSPVQIPGSWMTLGLSGDNAQTFGAIKPDYTLWMWGYGSEGQIGDRTVTPKSSPTQVPGSWTQVVTTNQVLGLRTDGTLWGWGNNTVGQLGHGNVISRSSPVQIGLHTYKQIAGGFNHSVLLRSDNTAWVVGQNNQGQLGDGTTINKSSPIQVGTSGYTYISAGGTGSRFISYDNSVAGTGQYPGNESVIATSSLVYVDTSFTQISSNPISIISSPVQIGTSSWSQVSTNFKTTMAIKPDGTLWGWGSNSEGHLGYITPATVTSLTAGAYIKSDGTLWGWGNNTALFPTIGEGTAISRSSPVQVIAGTTTGSWNQVSAFFNGVNPTTVGMRLAIDSNYRLFAWGSNTSGQLGNNTVTVRSFPTQIGHTRWASIATPYAIKEDGTLWGWGQNPQGAVGDTSTVNRSSPVQIGNSSWSAVGTNTIVGHAIRLDGTLWGWGENTGVGAIGDGTTVSKSSPVQIGASANWKTLAPYGSAAINNLGQLFMWGFNATGSIGDNTTASRSSPVQVMATSSFVAVATAGSNNLSEYSIFIDVLGKMYTTGSNSSGRLGDGTTINRSSPVQIGTGNSWTMCAAGGNNAFAIRTDGTLWAWGGGTSIGDGTTINRSSPVQIGTEIWQSIYAGASSAYGVRNNQLYVWGYNNQGQLGLNDNVVRSSPVLLGASNSFVMVSGELGYNNVMALTSNGELFALGGPNAHGYLPTNDIIARSSPVQIGTAGMNWMQISNGVDYAASIKDDSTLWLWGNNIVGQIGDGTTINRSRPVQITGSWNQVSLNGQGSGGWAFGIKADNTLWSWGWNYTGVLGLNDSVTYRSSPVQIGTSSWSVVRAGGWISGAAGGIDINGRLYMWGGLGSINGIIGDGTTIYRSSPVQIMSGRSFTQLAVGENTAMALENNGTLWAWGLNTEGGVGNNSTSGVSSPVQIGTSSWTLISAMGGVMTGVIDDGYQQVLYGWGNNTVVGQLGDGTTVNKSSPTQISTIFTSRKDIFYSSPVQVGVGYSWSNVSTGPYATIASRVDGTVWAWGMNFAGQLGQNDVIYRSSPVQISTAIVENKPKQISMNGDALFGIDAALYIAGGTVGRLNAFGYNANGQVGDGSTVRRSSPIQVAAATTQGAAPIIPINLTTTRGSSFTSVGLGTSFATAITSNGTLFTWGLNSFGQLGYNNDAATTSSPVTVGNNTQTYKVGDTSISASSWSQVSAGYNHSLAIDSNKQLFGWGNYAATNPIVTSTLSWKVLVPDELTIGIRSDDTLWAWGINTHGQVGDSSTINRSSPTQVGTDSWKLVSNGTNLAAGIKMDGTLWTWGQNTWGALGVYGGHRSTPVQVPGSWLTVSASLSSVAAIKSDGTLWTWGYNIVGQVGDNSTANRSSPVQIGRGTWRSVKSGADHVMAIDSDGYLYSWGNNLTGQLGDNSVVQRSSPLQIGTSKWTTIAAGLSFTLAIKADNTLWSWGFNTSGQAGDATGANRSSPVQVGTSLWSRVDTGPFYSSSYGTDVNGRLFVWGYNAYGGAGNNSVSAVLSPILLPTSFTLLGAGMAAAANDANGLLYVWGYNNFYNYGDYTSVSRSSPVLIVNNTISPNISSPVQIMSGSWNHINAGNDFSIAADSNNTLYFWGRNNLHQSGTSSVEPYITSPIVVGTSTNDTGAGSSSSGYIKKI